MTTKAELYAGFRRRCALEYGKPTATNRFCDPTAEGGMSAYGVAVVMLGLYVTNVYGNEWTEENGRLNIRDHYRHGWGRAEATGGVTFTFYPSDNNAYVRSVTLEAGYTPDELLTKLTAFVRLVRRIPQ